MKKMLNFIVVAVLCFSMLLVVLPRTNAQVHFSSLWSRNTAQTVQGMAVDDINGDGKSEVVYADWSGLVTAVDHLNKTLWTFQTGWYDSIRIGDLRGDGTKEVAIGSADDNVYCLDGATGHLLWKYPTAELAGHSISVADIYGNGKKEVITGEWDSSVNSASPANMYVLDPNGTLLWNYTFGDDVVTSSADVNNDGRAEVFAYWGRPQIASTGYLYKFNPDGTVNWTVPIPGCTWGVPFFLDVNGDDVKEIITQRNSDSAILIFNSTDGNLIEAVSDSYGGLLYAGDLNNDGQIEFITSDGSAVYGLNFTASEIWQNPIGGNVYSLLPADLMGNGQQEILVGSSGRLYVLNSTDGAAIWNATMQDDVVEIQVGHINGNRVLDIVAGTGLPWPNQANRETVVVFTGPIGDLNADFTVNILDTILLAKSFGCKPGDPNWNSYADLNGDGIVNILDAIILCGHFHV